MIHIVSWFWGHKYSPVYIPKLRDALKRNIHQPYTFNVASKGAWLQGSGWNAWSIADWHLLKEPGCIVRIRMFDWKWLECHGVNKGDKVVNLDIDSVVVANLDPLFDKYDRYDSFAILQGINTTNPNPYNGSLWMFTAGEHRDVWEDFSLEALHQVPKHSIYDDQAWLWHKLPNANGFGPDDGVYGYKKKFWPKGTDLPENARLVVFPGKRSPHRLDYVDWVVKHWGKI